MWKPIYQPEPWPQFLKRKDIKGLPIMEARKRYMQEQLLFENYYSNLNTLNTVNTISPSVASAASAGGGGGPKKSIGPSGARGGGSSGELVTYSLAIRTGYFATQEALDHYNNNEANPNYDYNSGQIVTSFLSSGSETQDWWAIPVRGGVAIPRTPENGWSASTGTSWKVTVSPAILPETRQALDDYLGGPLADQEITIDWGDGGPVEKINMGTYNFRRFNSSPTYYSLQDDPDSFYYYLFGSDSLPLWIFHDYSGVPLGEYTITIKGTKEMLNILSPIPFTQDSHIQNIFRRSKSQILNASTGARYYVPPVYPLGPVVSLDGWDEPSTIANILPAVQQGSVTGKPSARLNKSWVDYLKNTDKSQITGLRNVLNFAWGLEDFYNQNNIDASDWCGPSVNDLQNCFLQADHLPAGIENWDTSNVYSMSQMFFYYNVFGNFEDDGSDFFTNPSEYATRAAGIVNWDTTNVRILYKAFNYHPIIDVSLANWNLPNLENASQMFRNATGMSDANLELTLKGWADNPNTADNVNASSFATSRTYSVGSDMDLAIQVLTAKGWTISGITIV